MAKPAAWFHRFTFLLCFFSLTCVASDREELNEILEIMQTHLINRDAMD